MINRSNKGLNVNMSNDVLLSNPANQPSATEEEVRISNRRKDVTKVSSTISQSQQIPVLEPRKVQSGAVNNDRKTIRTSSKRKSSSFILEDFDNTPESKDGINVESIYTYKNSVDQGATQRLVNDSDYIPIPMNLGWTRIPVPELRCRTLVPRKRKENICEIEFEGNSWDVGTTGELMMVGITNDTDNKEQSLAVDGSTGNKSNSSLPIPFPPPQSVSYKTLTTSTVELFVDSTSTDLDDEPIEKSRRTRSRSQQSQKQQSNSTQQPRTRVGDNYQAVILDNPSTYDRSKDETNYSNGGEVLWDPQKANAAIERKEPIMEYLERKDLELNVKFLLMDSLHKSNYHTKAAMKLFIANYGTEQKRLIEFNEQEIQKFNEIIAPRMLATKEDFIGASKVMNRTPECIMVQYYVWKGLHKKYQKYKRERKTDADNCSVCNNIGTSIVCKLCSKAFHLKCCTPPLTGVPDGDWYCMSCTQTSPPQVQQLDDSTPPGVITSTTTSRASTPQSRPTEGSASSKLESKKPSLGEVRRQVLQAVHKELFSPVSKSLATEIIQDKSKERLAPSGMVWDAGDIVWKPAETEETELAIMQQSAATPHTCSDHSSHSPPAKAMSPHDLLFEEPGDVDTKLDPADDSSTSKSSVISVSSGISRKSDSTFDVANVDDDDDDDDDGEYCEDVPKKKGKQNNMPSTSLQTPSSQAKMSGQVAFYDVEVPITSEGLLIHIQGVPVANGGGVCFGGYRLSGNGKMGPAQQKQLFRSIGDKFFSIDGTVCYNKSFEEVKQLLRSNADRPTKLLRMMHLQETKSTSTKTAKHINNGMRVADNNNNNRIIPKQEPEGRPVPATAPTHPGTSSVVIQTSTAPTKPNTGPSVGPNKQSVTNPPIHGPVIGSIPLQPVTNHAPMTGHIPNPLQNRTTLPPQSFQVQQQQQMVWPIVPHNNMAYNQQIGVPTFNAVRTMNTASQQYTDYQIFQNALAPLGIPNLMHFLNRRGIFSASTFLQRPSATLASHWASEQGISFDVAVDFMGAARLQVRQYLASGF